ncbi:hypothetical protein KP509_20G087100 [Ceratopteris richardii]|uniref:WRKY domain-containing protein n=1 Tax=Ceratopteris richardii TaxID=49495 RepID=A0A8T2SKP0_CERRI|nr:hypothetical protein KP509_20G087100 [Ceratopteris richardii]
MVVDIRSQCIGSIAGDLDDVLDLLLQDAEVAVSATAKEQVHSGLCEGAPISVSESSTRGNHLPKESISPSDVPQTKSSSSPQRHASAGHIVGQRHAEMGANEESHVQSWVTPTVIQEEKPNVFSFPHGWPNQRVLETLLSCPRAVPREEVTEREQKEFPLSRSSHRWAGPTLMDIETALATACPSSACNIIAEPALSSSSPDSFWSTRLPHRNSALIRSVEDILKQETSSFLTASSSSVCNEEPKTPEDDDMKSYYRCSSGKCKVKKQVERSSEDAGMLVVSYEGIHLHHRPTSLPMPSTHACVSLLPTHDNPFQKSFPM